MLFRSHDMTVGQGMKITSETFDAKTRGLTRISSGGNFETNVGGQKKIQAAQIKMQEGAQTADNATKPQSPTAMASANPSSGGTDPAAVNTLA